LGKIPYCSKCAIDLALKGVRVFQIFDDDKNHRSPRNPALQYISSNEGLTESIDAAINNTLTPKGLKAAKHNNGTDEITVNSLASTPSQSQPQSTTASLTNGQLGKGSLNGRGSIIQDNERDIEEEELVRKVELEKFLAKLERVKINNSNCLVQVGNQRREMNDRHLRQVKKIEEVNSIAQRVIEQGFKRLLEEIEDSHNNLIGNYTKYEEQIHANLSEMDNIKNDIAMNLEKILKHMNLKPFKIICSKYEEKLDSFESANRQYSDTGMELKLSQLALNSKSLQSYELEFMNFLEPVLKTSARRFKLSEAKSAFLEEKNPPPSEGFSRNQHNRSPGKRANAVYVSFENKEIFQNEMRNSKRSDDKENEEVRPLQVRGKRYKKTTKTP
jgi:hypothetical protein